MSFTPPPPHCCCFAPREVELTKFLLWPAKIMTAEETKTTGNDSALSCVCESRDDARVLTLGTPGAGTLLLLTLHNPDSVTLRSFPCYRIHRIHPCTSRTQVWDAPKLQLGFSGVGLLKLIENSHPWILLQIFRTKRWVLHPDGYGISLC